MNRVHWMKWKEIDTQIWNIKQKSQFFYSVCVLCCWKYIADVVVNKSTCKEQILFNFLFIYLFISFKKRGMSEVPFLQKPRQYQAQSRRRSSGVIWRNKQSLPFSHSPEPAMKSESEQSKKDTRVYSK